MGCYRAITTRVLVKFHVVASIARTCTALSLKSAVECVSVGTTLRSPVFSEVAGARETLATLLTCSIPGRLGRAGWWLHVHRCVYTQIDTQYDEVSPQSAQVDEGVLEGFDLLFTDKMYG